MRTACLALAWSCASRGTQPEQSLLDCASGPPASTRDLCWRSGEPSRNENGHVDPARPPCDSWSRHGCCMDGPPQLCRASHRRF
eukprot:CAMPEP_0170638926 /NCGR_PEP_ID=MMETSP0224-20130122/39344_1 /TAXON_ID=285029 /ORGANISM="Togula jolla, Strain CCCM 725" /LENGTH=83 /DNA_ID=CAMNT_0010969183 /DNA_START=901 /DNA_END=1152 /DNA_ORIENTATION=+